MSDVLTTPTTSRSTLSTLTACLAVGAVGGALFGVAFGAIASVFHNGPALWTGIQESWGFFAVLGAAMGASWGWAHRPSRGTPTDPHRA